MFITDFRLASFRNEIFQRCRRCNRDELFQTTSSCRDIFGVAGERPHRIPSPAIRTVHNVLRRNPRRIILPNKRPVYSERSTESGESR